MALIYTLAASCRLRDMGWPAKYALLLALAPLLLKNVGRNAASELLVIGADFMAILGFVLLAATPGRVTRIGSVARGKGSEEC